MIKLNDKVAILRSEKQPTDQQLNKLEVFLTKKYGQEIKINWQEDTEIKDGFVLNVGSDVFDWTVEGKLRQLREELEDISVNDSKFIPLLKDKVYSFSPKATSQEMGTVEEIGDGIAVISGIQNVTYGEILEFSNNVKAMVLDIQKDQVGCIVFGDDDEITEGSKVVRTQRTAGVPVTSHMLGRVVDSLGNPIDGEGDIVAKEYYPLENPAPSIVERQPVSRAIETGILSIDSMFPIGRGQRELIIGDRQTGKTAIALDTIINQKDKGVVCIYVAIGQKASSVSQIVANLRKHGALDYTVVVCSTASDSASLQYIAPYAGCAIGEYFMNQGKDVLIVYDDLSKHAIAYRSISLLLERSPGREAYPGDVFYLHSRLLERSAQLSEKLGGGSMTALPIVETQAGDVSAYIPTNIISITDGQIFLESDLFFAGQRPAVNVGLSVSRVGGAAQTKAMKKAASAIRLDLAQYREMEVFTQFASDLDQSTKNLLAYGQGLMQLLRQEQFKPYSQHEQVIILIVALEKLLTKVDVKKVKEAMVGLLRHFEDKHKDIVNYIDSVGDFDPHMKNQIIDIARQYLLENYIAK